jgi:hypothetical protein
VVLRLIKRGSWLIKRGLKGIKSGFSLIKSGFIPFYTFDYQQLTDPTNRQVKKIITKLVVPPNQSF